MQKKTRDDWKKVVTGMKEVLEINCPTRHITSTEKLQEKVKEIALQYAKKVNPNYYSENMFLKAQITELKSQVEKYKEINKDIRKKNNLLKEKYEQEKNKSWLKKLLNK